jgi:hypothetical protein
MAYVLSHQGVLLSVGSMHMVVTAIAQAGFCAVMAYFLAGAKTGAKPVWWVPAGLALAALLNGLFSSLRQEIIVQGLTYNPLSALVLAAGFVALTLSVLFALQRRAGEHASPRLE